jgi:predicted nucleic acid-binding protein
MQHRIKLLDALHIASAERAEADYFCTTDDDLLKKAQGGLRTEVRIVSPIEFLEELENDN